MVDPQSTNRSAFGNHMFCEFTAKIHDACAGPVVGTVDRKGYVAATIDDVMPAGYSAADRAQPQELLPSQPWDAGWQC